jgi:hypothetical protein
LIHGVQTGLWQRQSESLSEIHKQRKIIFSRHTLRRYQYITVTFSSSRQKHQPMYRLEFNSKFLR